ncbi:hypothetical protein IC582_012455 [Cucumis melo]
MARSSQVPKFGKWDDGDDVPYTTYFDNATKAKFERMNPNDPLPHREEISETVRSNYEQQKIKEGGVVRRQPESPLHHDAPEMSGRDYNGIKSAKRRGQQLSGPKHTQEDLSMEDGNMKKQLGSPLDHRSMGQVSFNSPLHQRQGNNSSTSNSSKGTMRNGTVSECSIENSPLHSRQHPRTEPKTVVPSSPLRDRRGSSSPRGSSHEGLAPLTPGRSRLRSVPRGNETPDRGATVPRFGDWDESDPSSSENYTNIFTRVREERQTEDGSLPAGTNVSSIRSRSGAENSKRCCCFPWGK